MCCCTAAPRHPHLTSLQRLPSCCPSAVDAMHVRYLHVSVYVCVCMRVICMCMCFCKRVIRMCMCFCMRVSYVHVSVYVCMYFCMRVWYVLVSVYVCVCVFVCASDMCIWVFIGLCMYFVCVCACVCVCAYVCVFVWARVRVHVILRKCWMCGMANLKCARRSNWAHRCSGLGTHMLLLHVRTQHRLHHLQVNFVFENKESNLTLPPEIARCMCGWVCTCAQWRTRTRGCVRMRVPEQSCRRLAGRWQARHR